MAAKITRTLSSIAAGTALLALCGCRPIAGLSRGYLSACPARGPERHDDFGHYVPPFDLSAHETAVRAFAGALEVREMARVVDGGAIHPISLLRWRGRAARARALIVAGVHGNEVPGVLAMERLLGQLAAAPPPTYERWQLYLVPALNPVGLAHASRYNGEGCDINRDFGVFRTPEARVLRDVIREVRPDVVVSLKESAQDGFMVVVTAAGSRAVGEAVAAAVDAAGVPLATETFLGTRLPVRGLWMEGPLLTRLKRLGRTRTLGSYALAQGIPTYTMEAPWASPDVDGQVRAHLAAVEAVLGHAGSARP